MPLNRLIRVLHTYVGLLIAPSLLFFAFTGGLQILELHEKDQHPPAIVSALAMLHKHQRLPAAAPAERAPAAHAEDHDHDDHHDHEHAEAASPRPPEAPREKPAPPPRTVALKLLFLAVAAGLFVSTCLGAWMALLAPRTRPLYAGLLALGTLLPLLALLLPG